MADRDRRPRYRVGDWVTAYGSPVRRLVQVIEYRGPLGRGGEPIYRLRHAAEWGVREFEQREDWLEPARPDEVAAGQAAAARPG